MLPLWILLVGIASLSRAILLILQKRISDGYRSSDIAYYSTAFAFLSSLPVGLWAVTEYYVSLTLVSMLFIGLSIVLNVGGVVLYLKAFSTDDISLVVPLMSLSPLFIAVFEPMVLDTVFDPVLIIAGALAVVGSFIVLGDGVNIQTVRNRIRSVGPMLAIATSIVYSGTAFVDKVALTLINPYTFTSLVLFGMTVFFIIHRYSTAQTISLGGVQKNKDFLPIGIATTFLIFGILSAYAITPTASQVSILMQTSVILSVVLGGVAFEESGVIQRVIGSAGILAGIVLIV